MSLERPRENTLVPFSTRRRREEEGEREVVSTRKGFPSTLLRLLSASVLEVWSLVGCRWSCWLHFVVWSTDWLFYGVEGRERGEKRKGGRAPR